MYYSIVVYYGGSLGKLRFFCVSVNLSYKSLNIIVVVSLHKWFTDVEVYRKMLHLWLQIIVLMRFHIFYYNFG